MKIPLISALPGIVLAIASIVVIWLPIDVDIKIWILRPMLGVILVQTVFNTVLAAIRREDSFSSAVHGFAACAALLAFVATIFAFGTNPNAIKVFLTLAIIMSAVEDLLLLSNEALRIAKEKEDRPHSRRAKATEGEF